MGKFSSYGAVYCRLIIDGKSHGVFPFMVPLRDPVTFEPLPGIEMGDIGPKFGYNSKDNGYMILKNVRIPRTNLFKRFYEVDRQGNFNIKGDLRIVYCIMLETRVLYSQISPLDLSKALTIGIRYGVVRRQFST